MGSQDLGDIEDGTVQAKCFACGQKQPKFVKTLERTGQSDFPMRIRTITFMGFCKNKDCFRYVDEAQCPSWVRA